MRITPFNFELKEDKESEVQALTSNKELPSIFNLKRKDTGLFSAITLSLILAACGGGGGGGGGAVTTQPGSHQQMMVDQPGQLILLLILMADLMRLLQLLMYLHLT